MIDRKKYRYFLSIDDKKWYECVPSHEPSIDSKRPEKEFYYTRELGTDIEISIDDPYRINKGLFRRLEAMWFDNNMHSQRIRFVVRKDGEVYWEGYFTIRQGNLDVDLGIYTFRPKPEDSYHDYEQIKDVEIDIIDANIPKKNLHFKQTSQTEELFFSTWQSAQQYWLENPEEYPKWKLCSIPEDSPVIYKRQKVLINPGGLGWYQERGYYYKPACSELTLINELGPFRRLDETIQFVLDEKLPGFSFESRLLNDQQNYISGVDPNPLRNLYVAQKSDIRREATEEATIGMCDLETLINWLKYLFNAGFVIENKKLIVEHSERLESTVVGVDLTNGSMYDPLYLKKTNKYTQHPSELPRREKWKFMEAGTPDYLEGRTIEYDINQTSTNEEDYSLTSITTDLKYLLNFPDEISNDGFVLVVANDEGEILSESAIFSGLFLPNAHLSIANLQRAYWRHQRYLKQGIMSGDQIEFISERRKRKQTAIRFLPHSKDLLDPQKLFRTILLEYEPVFEKYLQIAQEGRVVSMSHDLKSDYVDVELIYSDFDYNNVLVAIAKILSKSFTGSSLLLTGLGKAGELAPQRKVKSVAAKCEVIEKTMSDNELKYSMKTGFIL